jgi:hypothetical protein
MARSKPIILIQSILTGLGILFAGTALAEVVDPVWPALGALLVIAAKGTVDFYVNATTTPTATVIATQQAPGEPVVAGLASKVETGEVLHASDAVREIATLTAPPSTPI